MKKVLTWNEFSITSTPVLEGCCDYSEQIFFFVTYRGNKFLYINFFFRFPLQNL